MAEQFVVDVVHQEISKLLRIVDEICGRYPATDELRFIQYLLRMVAEASLRDEGGE
ncbi:hypothetical protein [Neorhizobium sp. NCHU2750]|uniref:hypothetical protein n=1 Tax=Neorhizobium sp. NCHU2750 TaxID=1825976 RepID=UPI000EB6A76E|nr:hypothetical protein NCHU2750_12510 [Neorhizobium sp. NCHU2750]